MADGSQRLSHFDASGEARMVHVGEKERTLRTATAAGEVRCGRETAEAIRAGRVGKGDVLGVARIAATMAAKRTPDLIPLCHPVALTGIDVRFGFREGDAPGISIEVDTEAVDRTGAEMEALTAVAVAALTVYDMCKSMDRTMTIERVRLLAKRGGKSGEWSRPGP